MRKIISHLVCSITLKTKQKFMRKIISHLAASPQISKQFLLLLDYIFKKMENACNMR